MDLWYGPAALGGIMMCVALSAWALGRWQGTFAVPDDGAGRLPVDAGTAAPSLRSTKTENLTTPCQTEAFAARSAVLAVADSLGELHAEISAYRRAEQVFANTQPDELVLRHRSDDTGRACRHIGLTGKPICDLSDNAHRTCATAAWIGSACARQPSAMSIDRLRV